MDGFDNEYMGHMIFFHASGPDAGPWVGNYSVLATNDQSELYSVLHGIATGTFSSIELATSAASTQARQRLDDFLAQCEHRAKDVLR